MKFLPQAVNAVEEACCQGAPQTVRIPSLATLWIAYGVTAIESLVSPPLDFAAIKAKFPKRSQRAPPAAGPPSPAHCYIVRFNPARDVQEVVNAFRANPYVEDVQPNYLAVAYQEKMKPTHR